MGIYVIIAIVVAVVVFAIPAMWFAGVYNQLVVLVQRFKNAYSQIDVQLKRRHDLIPNLVETAKGYMAHERGTLEAVIAARNTAVAARTAAAGAPTGENVAQVAAAEGALTGTLSRLMAVIEQYPNLKADEQMNQLMEELTSTENRIAFARQAYNDAVMTYNTQRQVFPNVVVANFFHFEEAKLFEVTDTTEREAPKVAF